MAEAVRETASEVVDFVEAVADGYLAAAGGNPSLALRRAARDVVAAEERVLATERLVSRGYVRTPLSAGA